LVKRYVNFFYISKYYYEGAQWVPNPLQSKTHYYRLWKQSRGAKHQLKKEQEKLRPKRPPNQIQEIGLISSTSLEGLGVTPLKITLLRNFQKLHVVANQGCVCISFKKMDFFFVFFNFKSLLSMYFTHKN
jgi:hypothetical protein